MSNHSAVFFHSYSISVLSVPSFSFTWYSGQLSTYCKRRNIGDTFNLAVWRWATKSPNLKTPIFLCMHNLIITSRTIKSRCVWDCRVVKSCVLLAARWRFWWKRTMAVIPCSSQVFHCVRQPLSLRRTFNLLMKVSWKSWKSRSQPQSHARCQLGRSTTNIPQSRGCK